MTNRANPEDKNKFETSYKLGLVATLDKNGDPHISLLTTIMAKSDTEIMFGKFIVGESKEIFFMIQGGLSNNEPR